MTSPEIDPREERVLILAPTGRDAVLTERILAESGISSQPCSSMEELCFEMLAGGGAALLTEESLNNRAIGCLLESLEKQPAWSDFPLIVFAINAESSGVLLSTLGERANLIVLERPINISVVISAVRSALRARRRQYQTRSLFLELEEADRQKDLFLATLSHELRTPLNSVLGWIHLLRGGSLGEADAERALDTIERNARAQIQLITDILFVSRVITGKLNLDMSQVDLRAVAQAAIDVVQPSIDNRQIRLKTSFDPNLSAITGDPGRLQQVVWNLLSNAAKFTPPGGEIELAIRSTGRAVQIVVKDSGKGINPDFLPFVFDRFRQADNSYRRGHGGLGLGLAIVKHLVDLHGGTVRAESAGEGQGAMFIVSLPASAETAVSSEKDRPKVKQVEPSLDAQVVPEYVRGLKALIVEDDADSREMLVNVISQWGIEPVAVGSAAEALEAIEQVQPDVLISDIGMPGQDGYDLIRKVREMEPAKGGLVPAVALSGYASEEDKARSLLSGFQAHITKPIQLDLLINTLNTLLR
ncbi:MAG TPA: ATP-binding protein [Blastocatellia bacterium]|nr:ATP-binding protein [Blastocatellia bacterium]